MSENNADHTLTSALDIRETMRWATPAATIRIEWTDEAPTPDTSKVFSHSVHNLMAAVNASPMWKNGEVL